MLDVCLLGTSGMLPLPGRWLTSMMTRFNGSSLLIDCGEGTQIAIREKGWSFHDIDTILLTHFHADHVSGLPGLLLTIGNSDRTEPLTIVGPKGVERVVKSLLVVAPELPFELVFKELTTAEETFAIKGMEITAFKVSHSVACYGYSIRIRRNGKFDAAAARERGIPVSAWNRLQHGQTVVDGDVTYTPDMVLGPERKGLKVTYSTDTRPVPQIAEHAAGSDLFICEGMYGEKGKDAKAREHKHMTWAEAAKIGAKAQPTAMWLTHFSPSLVRPDQYVADVKKIFAPIEAGKDGKTIELNFEDEL